MRCLSCILMLLVFCPLLSRGQNTFTSPYSVYGIGLINNRSASLSRSMAGTGIAVQSNDNINVANPAAYVSVLPPISHIFETGVYVESNGYSTENVSERKTNGGLSNLNYWFKFKPWWGSMLGLSPFSSVSYNIISQKDLGSGVTGNYTYKGSGNIDQLYWGNSFKIKKFSFGFNSSFLFGSVHRSETLQSSSIPNSLTLDHKIFTNKFHLDFGVQYRLDFEKRSLVVGAIYDNGMTLHGTSRIALYNSNSDTINSHNGDKIIYKLPRSAGFGLSLQSKRSIIAADVKYKQWTQASFSDQAVNFNDTYRVSAGYAYLGNPRAVKLSGLIALKAGAYIENYYLQLKGTNISMWGFSAGASLPMMDGRSSVNLTYSFDQLGTKNNGLVQQQSQKFMLDVIIRDLWGIRRKFD